MHACMHVNTHTHTHTHLHSFQLTFYFSYNTLQEVQHQQFIIAVAEKPH